MPDFEPLGSFVAVCLAVTGFEGCWEIVERLLNSSPNREGIWGCCLARYSLSSFPICGVVVVEVERSGVEGFASRNPALFQHQQQSAITDMLTSIQHPSCSTLNMQPRTLFGLVAVGLVLLLSSPRWLSRSSLGQEGIPMLSAFYIAQA